MASPGHINNLTDEQKIKLQIFTDKLQEKLKETDLEESHRNIWGIPVTVESGAGTKAQMVIFLKFLRARQFNVDTAIEMIVNSLKWRREYNVIGLMEEKFEDRLSEAGFMYGTSRNGDPVTYTMYGNLGLNPTPGQPRHANLQDIFVRWRVQLMEKAMRSLDFKNGIERIVQVHDYCGMKKRGHEPEKGVNVNVRQAAGRIIKMFQDNYPETVVARLFIGVSKAAEVFSSFFVDANTRETVRMVSESGMRALMLEYIHPGQLPPMYGGLVVPKNISLPNPEYKMVEVAAGKETKLPIQVTAGSTVVWHWYASSGEALTCASMERDGSVKAVELTVDGEPVYGKPRKHAGGTWTADSDGTFMLRVECKGDVGWLFFLSTPPVQLHYVLTVADPALRTA